MNDKMYPQNFSLALAATRVDWLMKALSELENAQQKPLLFLLWDEIKAIYFELRLVVAKHQLCVLLSSASGPKCTDLPLLLWAGELLYRADEFRHAIVCFNCVIEGLDHDDQDIRLKALTGRLESEIAIRLQGWTDGKIDLKVCRDAKSSHGIILRDLYAASPAVQADLKVRLARMTINIGMLATGTQVNPERKAFETSF